MLVPRLTFHYLPVVGRVRLSILTSGLGHLDQQQTPGPASQQETATTTLLEASESPPPRRVVVGGRPLVAASRSRSLEGIVDLPLWSAAK